MIYAAYNTITGKYYVGQTVRTLMKRKRTHEWDAKRGSQTYFHRSIRKYGTDAFWWVIFSEENDSKKSMIYLERYFIKAFESRNIKNGYNMTDGGDGTVGCRLSQETLQKRSIALKGRIFSPEHCKKISIAKKGIKTHKPAWNRGIHITEEARQKLKETLRKKYAAKTI